MTEPIPHPADFWESLDDGRIKCTLCPRYCKLREEHRGFCFVRQNQGGKLVLTTYGRTSGFAIDPVEKKPLYHFYPGSTILSFGTAGCNLGCRFCQNWDLSKSRSMDRMTASASPGAIAQSARKNGCRSVAFTYNEPIIFAEYAIEICRACRELDVRTVAVTSGYITGDARPDFFAGIDGANVDLKSFSEQFYRDFCAGHLQPVLDTLIYLKKETDVWLEITNLIIPGANDSEAELHSLTEWIVTELGPDVPLHFSAYHPDFKLTDRRSTSLETLHLARDIALSKGIKFVYTGNVHDSAGSTTLCPACGAVLIERDWYRLGTCKIKKGLCEECGEKVPGRFE
ncbi:AmmeMemoRadiSam system radical SAM enzyme [Fibrobacterota bacterium]